MWHYYSIVMVSPGLTISLFGAAKRSAASRLNISPLPVVLLW